MTVQPLLTYPDPRLRTVAVPVVVFDDGLAALAADLVAAVESAPAIGLAAPHLGVLRRVIAVRPSSGAAIRVYVNPSIERPNIMAKTASQPMVSTTTARM